MTTTPKDFTSYGPIYGLMAEFDSAQELVDAAHKTHQAGYQKIDASNAVHAIASYQVAVYLLGTCATVKEADTPTWCNKPASS